MGKITIFEDIGGFIFSPKTYTLETLMKQDRKWRTFTAQSIIFISLSAVFAGCVLMFYMMYPEVFFCPIC